MHDENAAVAACARLLHEDAESGSAILEVQSISFWRSLSLARSLAVGRTEGGIHVGRREGSGVEEENVTSQLEDSA
jgi:hypothetical protein